MATLYLGRGLAADARQLVCGEPLLTWFLSEDGALALTWLRDCRAERDAWDFCRNLPTSARGFVRLRTAGGARWAPAVGARPSPEMAARLPWSMAVRPHREGTKGQPGDALAASSAPWRNGQGVPQRSGHDLPGARSGARVRSCPEDRRQAGDNFVTLRAPSAGLGHGPPSQPRPARTPASRRRRSTGHQTRSAWAARDSARAGNPTNALKRYAREPHGSFAEGKIDPVIWQSTRRIARTTPGAVPAHATTRPDRASPRSPDRIAEGRLCQPSSSYVP